MSSASVNITMWGNEFDRGWVVVMGNNNIRKSLTNDG